jgi:hypothetical protein
VQFQRPVCVYPEVARYRGGNPDLAASFECGARRAADTGGRASKTKQSVSNTREPTR